MQQSRSRPRAFMVLLGLIAIVASACSGTTASTAPSTAPTAAPSTAVAATATPPPAITPVPVAPGRARPERRRRHQLVRRPRRRRPAAAAPGRGDLRRRLQRVAEGGLHRPRDPEQQRRRAEAQDPHRCRRRAGHHRAGRRRGPEPLPRQSARPGAAHRQDRLQRPRRRPQAGRLLQARREQRDDRRPVRRLPVVHVLQQGPLRRGRTALPADQGRGAVPGQAVGHGRGPRPRHEADRRHRRQRRDQREVRSDEGRPVGLRHAVCRQQPAGRDVALRGELIPGRRRQVRPDPRAGLDRGEVVQRRRLEGSLHPQRRPDQQRPARQGQ